MPVITVKNLCKYYRTYKKQSGLLGSIRSLVHREYHDAKAVDDISFSIDEGELIGFIGPNGAGKTTTLKMLSGLLHPTSGQLKVIGHKPYERREEFLRRIALVMGQKNQLWWDLPAIESFQLNKEIYRIPDSQFSETVGELSELLDVGDVLQVQVRNLSLGQRMKCELIAALLHRPRILFLDEPTIGLDVVMQKRLRDFVKLYNEKYRSTILLTSHYMDDVKELCRRVIIIDHGRILYDGALDDIVRKYATKKYISVVFSETVKRDDLSKLGEVIEFSFPKATLEVPREDSNAIAARVLRSLPVVDINVEEPDIEEIIRKVFA